MAEDAMAQLAAALNGHSVTDENGQIQGETDTPVENTALEDQTTVTEPETEAPVEEESKPPKADDETKTDAEVAEDETGQRYVPEKRFKDIYGKWKTAERTASQALRKAGELESKISTGQQILESTVPSQKQKPLEKADVVEIELLKTTMPQFDPMIDPATGLPTNPDYSPELDSLGTTILRANPGMSRLEAARRAIATAKSLGSSVNTVKQEARTVKSLQSDQGITTRVVSRTQTKNPEEMSLEEMEQHLKQSGQW